MVLETGLVASQELTYELAVDVVILVQIALTVEYELWMKWDDLTTGPSGIDI